MAERARRLAAAAALVLCAGASVPARDATLADAIRANDAGAVVAALAARADPNARLAFGAMEI